MDKAPKTPTPKKVELGGPFRVRIMAYSFLEERLNEAYLRGWDAVTMDFDGPSVGVVFRKTREALRGLRSTGPFDSDDDVEEEKDDD